MTTTPVGSSALTTYAFGDPSIPQRGFSFVTIIPHDIIALFFSCLSVRECVAFSMTSKKVKQVLDTHPSLENVRKTISVYYEGHVIRLLAKGGPIPQAISDGFHLVSQKIKRLNLSTLDVFLRIEDFWLPAPGQSISLLTHIEHRMKRVAQYLVPGLNKSLASRGPLEEVAHYFPYTEEATFDGYQFYKITDVVEKLLSCRALSRLSFTVHDSLLSERKISSKDWRALMKLPKIQHLDFSGRTITFTKDDIVPEELARIKEVHLFNIAASISSLNTSFSLLIGYIFGRNHGFKRTDISFEAAQVMKILPIRSVKLDSQYVLKELANEELTSLSFDSLDSSDLKEEDYQTLRSLRKLKLLELSLSMSSVNLQFLSEYKELRSLIVSSKNALPALPACPSIKDIFLRGGLTDQVIDSLSNMDQLRNLSLRVGGDFDLSSLRSLFHLKNLQGLYISAQTIKSSAISEERLRNAFPNLRHLCIFSDLKQELSFLYTREGLSSIMIMGGSSGHLSLLSTLRVSPSVRHFFYKIPLFSDHSKILNSLNQLSFIEQLETLYLDYGSSFPIRMIRSLPCKPKKLYIAIAGIRSAEENLEIEAFCLERQQAGQEVTFQGCLGNSTIEYGLPFVQSIVESFAEHDQ